MPINTTSARARVMLDGATGTTKLLLANGVTLTGTIDTSTLNAGVVKITDASPTTWVVPVDIIVAVGQ